MGMNDLLHALGFLLFALAWGFILACAFFQIQL